MRPASPADPGQKDGKDPRQDGAVVCARSVQVHIFQDVLVEDSRSGLVIEEGVDGPLALAGRTGGDERPVETAEHFLSAGRR